MAGRPLDELNAGLVTFKDELAADALAMNRVEVGIADVTDPTDTPGAECRHDRLQLLANLFDVSGRAIEAGGQCLGGDGTMNESNCRAWASAWPALSREFSSSSTAFIF